MGNFKIFLLIILSLMALASCDQIGHEPVIEGKSEKYFDYKSQEHRFKVKRYDGGRYDHKIDWHIFGLTLLDRNGNYSSAEMVKRVDTLTNGDMRISSDWVTCVVSRDKASVRVILKENTTDSTRTASFDSRSTGKVLSPNFTIYQRPKGQ